MGLFFFFESREANVATFFAVCTVVLTLGPEWFMPSLDPTRGVPVIETKMGHVKGVKLRSRDLDREIFAYYGIPYAKPPLGTLRFSRPEPLELPWEGVLDGTRQASSCVAKGIDTRWYSAHRGQEDCLILNVYVPNYRGKTKKLPVMVWIHGGGFTTGEASDVMYGPSYLLDRDVILVTVQYRLGPLGFLDLGQEEIGGNQGLWDQRAALQWVQENVASFGGDRRRVTLFGESAGAFSVMYHLSAPDSAGLFSRAVAQSGSLDGTFHNLDRGRPMSQLHEEFAAAVGCGVSGSDFGRVAECLRGLPVERLLERQHMFDECNTITALHIPFPSPWKPVHDSGRDWKPFFATESTPRETLKAGEIVEGVTLMIGFTKDEGLLKAGPLVGDPEKIISFQQNWDKCIMESAFGKSFHEDQSEIDSVDAELIKWIEQTYFDGRRGKEVRMPGDLGGFNRLFSDTGFVYPAHDAVRSLLSTGYGGDVYFYRFDHVGSFSMSDLFTESPAGIAWTLVKKFLGFHGSKKLGVAHADDLPYLFSSRLPLRFHTDKRDLDVSRKMVDLWANFATNGDPTPKNEDGDIIGDHLQHLKNRWSPSSLRETKWGRFPSFAVLSDSDDLERIDDQEEEDSTMERLAFWEEALAKVKFT